MNVTNLKLALKTFSRKIKNVTSSLFSLVITSHVAVPKRRWEMQPLCQEGRGPKYFRLELVTVIKEVSEWGFQRQKEQH